MPHGQRIIISETARPETANHIDTQYIPRLSRTKYVKCSRYINQKVLRQLNRERVVCQPVRSAYSARSRVYQVSTDREPLKQFPAILSDRAKVW